jgi:hypothetical protein
MRRGSYCVTTPGPQALSKIYEEDVMGGVSSARKSLAMFLVQWELIRS